MEISAVPQMRYTQEEIPNLITECAQWRGDGYSHWACKKRGRGPQAHVVLRMKRDGTWTEELERLP